MKNQKPPSRRNLVRQVVEIRDKEGKVTSTKAIFHTGKFNYPQYGSFADWRKRLLSMPNLNSKRQKIIRAKHLIADIDIIRRGDIETPVNQ